MKLTTLIALILVIVGALNWLVIGAFSFDLVAFVFGAATVVTRIIYALVGLAGLWTIFFLFAYKPFKKLN